MSSSVTMPSSTMPSHPWLYVIATVGAILLCDLLLLMPASNILQSWAALGLAALLPGALLTETVLGRDRAAIAWSEWLVYTVGLGYGLLVLTLLGLSYLPGGLTFAQVTLTLHGLILLLLCLLWLRTQTAPLPLSWPTFQLRWSVVALVALLIGAAYLRFTNLGYSELHGDEALVALRAVDVIQGWERALFIHKKGPGEILLGTALYVLTGGLTEFAAHLPFALASWVGVLATYILGRRWFGAVAGWWAAAMVMVDGYLMAFGRMLQYQSIIFLLVVLTVLAMQRVLDRRQSSARYLWLAAFFLATGLLSHYEAVMATVPALWLLIGFWRTEAGDWRAKSWQVARQMAMPLAVGSVILLAFYVPFIRDPEFFRDTFAYIFGFRLAGRSVPEGLAIVVGRSTLYSSSYYFWLLVLLTLVGLGRAYWRYAPTRLRLPLFLLLIAVMAALLIDSAAFFRLPGRLALILSGTLLLPVWFARRVPQAERTAWLWFGVAWLGIIFFVIKPGTHVYVFFIPWAFVSGMVVGQIWGAVLQRWPSQATRPLLATALVLLVLIFGNYVRWLFVVNQVEVLRTWDENRPGGYWTSYKTPAFQSIFGFPIRNGWKSVAALYAQGVLKGRFDTNDRFSMVPDWYLRGEEYCPRDAAQYYLLVPYPMPIDRPIVDEKRRQLMDDSYLWGTVTANAQPHMEIYARTATLATERADAPRIIAEETYTDFFNSQRLAPFTRNGPLGAQPIPNPTAYRFGDHIHLLGYSLDRAQVTPNDEIEVVLYWRTDQPLDTNYYVSIQIIDLIDAHKVGQRDGEPGCNRFPTTTWTPGDRIYDRYHVPIAPDARPGDYSIYVTMYAMDAANGHQTPLPVTQADGQVIGGAVLGTIDVATDK